MDSLELPPDSFRRPRRRTQGRAPIVPSDDEYLPSPALIPDDDMPYTTPGTPEPGLEPDLFSDYTSPQPQPHTETRPARPTPPAARGKRRNPRRQVADTESGQTPRPTPQATPDNAAPSPTAPRTAAPVRPSEPSEPLWPKIKDVLADGRLGIFLGVVMILAATYMLVASISYIANSSADQSLLVNSPADVLQLHGSSVKNTTGWVGAFLSHFLVYRWLGVGAFIIIFYVGALGVALVGLAKIKFWSFSFKTLLTAVCVSLIAGLVTISTVTPTFWGGEHGFFINRWIIDNASLWGAVSVSIASLTALLLIFATPLSKIWKTAYKSIRKFRIQLARRHDRAMQAAHRTEMRHQAEREAARQSVSTDTEPSPVTPNPEPTIQIRRTGPTPDDTLESMDGPIIPSGVDTFDDNPIHPNSDVRTDKDDIKEPPVLNITSSSPDDTPAPHPKPAPLDELFAPTSGKKPSESVADAIPMTISVLDDAPSAELTPSATPEGETVMTEAGDDSTPRPIPPLISTVEAETVILESTENQEEPDAEVNTPEDTLYDPRADLSHFTFPDVELLQKADDSKPSIDEEEQEANKERIVNILLSYGVEISQIRATIGPTITLYEIIPAPGVRISKIKRLGDDVALNLAAMGIRIIAPIPGKGTIGMEVPNKSPQLVSIRSILSSPEYLNSKAQLPMALGKTISNDVYVADLAKMPHLLVAGATGMGKSVGLNTIIASLIYRKHPAELKFVLIDPKRVEFSLYKCLERHYLAKLSGEEQAVITDSDSVIATLNSLCVEMESRYELLSQAGMRGIKEYNEKFCERRLNPEKGHRFLPYIVVVIDEFADLILTVGREVEVPISRIAAKARAVGIHMILATQRPSVNVITGVIKANFPGRIAFRVTQRNDSQTILDRLGAEQLIGRGDMLISRDGIIDRVQCAFIDTPEVESICDYISSQQGYPFAYELPDVAPAGGGHGNAGALTDRDPLFAEAGREVIAQGIGSTSSLQRKFNIGYPRAGKIMDQLEIAGVVGPNQGGKPRAVLMDMYSFEQIAGV